MEKSTRTHRELFKLITVLSALVAALLVGATQASASSPEGTFLDCQFPGTDVPQGYSGDPRYTGGFTVCRRSVITFRFYELICKDDGILYSRPDYLVVRDRLYYEGNAGDGPVTWYFPSGSQNDRFRLYTSVRQNAQLFFTESRDSGEFDDPSQDVPIGPC